jgi:DnaJ-class molecular chaperone
VNCTECDGKGTIEEEFASPDQWARGEAERQCWWCGGSGDEPEEEESDA